MSYLKEELAVFDIVELWFYVISRIRKKSNFPSHLTNLSCIDAIILLSNTLVTLVDASYSDEVLSGFKSSLGKSIDELVSIYRRTEALKKESMSILSFKRKR